jgi:oligopeptide/dipeptide ABC transporter ATP-binding protein
MNRVLKMVNIQPDYLMRFPHEFSGGQRQRLCIARALEVTPEVLICDEPVSSLDYSIRKQILHLLNELQEKYEMTYLLITHDLSNVPYLCKEVAIMYQGRVVEFIDHTDSLKETAVHPYTKDLFDSIPVKEPKMRRIGLQEKKIFSDTIPEQGCPYQNRCRRCTNICREHIPELTEIETGHFAACHML